MRNSKDLKATLSFIMILAIFICMIIMILDMCVSGTSWFYWPEAADGGPYKLTLDWHYAGIYFTFMLIALFAWLARTIMFTIPAMKANKSQFTMLTECLIGLGIVMAIIALFLPLGVEVTGELYGEEIYDSARMQAGVIMAWLAMPMAFISSLASVGLHAKHE